jgi:hypothetical protein
MGQTRGQRGGQGRKSARSLPKLAPKKKKSGSSVHQKENRHGIEMVKECNGWDFLNKDGVESRTRSLTENGETIDARFLAQEGRHDLIPDEPMIAISSLQSFIEANLKAMLLEFAYDKALLLPVNDVKKIVSAFVASACSKEKLRQEKADTMRSIKEKWRSEIPEKDVPF